WGNWRVACRDTLAHAGHELGWRSRRASHESAPCLSCATSPRLYRYGERMAEEKRGLIRVVESINSVLGAGLGATVGAQIGDPIAGAMAGEALAQVGEDFLERVLSPRQESRI